MLFNVFYFFLFIIVLLPLFKIPPFLGFFAKLFVLNSLTNTNIIISIIAIITSVISCVRYLNLIQISNFEHSNVINNYNIPSFIAYSLSFLTLFICLAFISPIYLLSVFTSIF